VDTTKSPTANVRTSSAGSTRTTLAIGGDRRRWRTGEPWCRWLPRPRRRRAL